MKLALVGNLQAIHFVRWIEALRARGHDVRVYSSHWPRQALRSPNGWTELPFPAPWGYLANVLFLRSALRRTRPDVLHVHFASGYGTLATLTGFHPRMVSVWGSDVYLFPERSTLHRRWIAEVLRRADLVTATSHAMAGRTRSLVDVPIEVVPFGVDADQFSPNPDPGRSGLTVGTARSLKHRYGLDVLIRAFADFAGRQPDREARLLIAGDGPERHRLQWLAADLGVAASVGFVGHVSHADMPAFMRQLDIFVMPSRHESFGVAALEACACEVPVIVSDAGGLPEVVIDGQTGLVVEREDVAALADALWSLAESEPLRMRLGRAGRARVLEEYLWDQSVDRMEAIYRRFL
jgi:glycosyltransferase involved in cell wall biosynthesis